MRACTQNPLVYDEAVVPNPIERHPPQDVLSRKICPFCLATCTSVQVDFKYSFLVTKVQVCVLSFFCTIGQMRLPRHFVKLVSEENATNVLSLTYRRNVPAVIAGCKELARPSFTAQPRPSALILLAREPRKTSKNSIATLRQLEFPVRCRRNNNITNSNRHKNRVFSALKKASNLWCIRTGNAMLAGAFAQ